MKSLLGSPYLLVATVAACSGDAPARSDGAGEPTATVRDSAGVSIVENAVPGGLAPAYAELGPLELEIGVMDGDPAYTFSRITAARTLEGGEILVAEGRAQELRVFDAEGTHLRTIGRAGEGPGEFGTVSGLAELRGDTVRVWDGRNRRVSSFLTDGTFLYDFSTSTVQFRSVRSVVYLPDRTLLTLSTDFPEGGPAAGATTSEVVRRVDLETGPDTGTDTIAVLPGREMMIGEQRTVTTDDGRTQRVTLIMSPMISGQAYVAVGAEYAYVGHSARYAIQRYLPSGDLDLILTVPDLDRPMEDAEAETIVRNRLEACDGDQRCEDYVHQMSEAFDPPELRPAFSDLRVDDLGDLWVAEWEHDPDDVAGWHVFTSDGELRGRVAIPPGLRIQEIGADYVLGVRENELDVPFVQRYALSRLR